MKICALIPSRPHITNARHRSRSNTKRYYGLQMVIDVVERQTEWKVDYATPEQLHEYDIVLYSCLAVPDYYDFLYTILRKCRRSPGQVWIAGGPGITNINPFLPYFDYIVIGRGESLIVPLLYSIAADSEFVNPSVVNVKLHADGMSYPTNYAQALYPHEVNGVPETQYGCKYNCSYCRYRTATLPPNMRESDRETTMPGNEETFWDLDIKDGRFHTTSLDGLTESVRKAVQKPITNKMLVKGLEKWSKQTPKINLKVYLIVGYPFEHGMDLSQLKEAFQAAAKLTGKCDVFIQLHFTPFEASPHTPMQWDGINVNTDFRAIVTDMRSFSPYLVELPHFRVMMLTSTMMPLTLVKRMVFNRASPRDKDVLEYLGSHTEQITHSSNNAIKLVRLLNRYDVHQFVKQYKIGDPMPFDNIQVWKSSKQLEKEAFRTRSALRSCSRLVS